MENYWDNMVGNADLPNHKRHGGYGRNNCWSSYDLRLDIFSTRKVMDQDKMGSRAKKTKRLKVVYVRNNNMSHHVGFNSVVFHAPSKSNGNDPNYISELENYYVLFL
jgi:hypothetical protein